MLKKYIACFLISMVPLIELRGAILYAFNPYFMGDALPLVPAYITCIVGNMLPVPFIFFFARHVLEWGKDKPVIGKFFTFCLEKGQKGGEKLQAKAGRGLFLALLLFVGIPLPGTGAWTGIDSEHEIQGKRDRGHAGRCTGRRHHGTCECGVVRYARRGDGVIVSDGSGCGSA